MVNQDKRASFRINLKRQVQLAFSSKVYDNCKMDNIALGGIFVTGTFSHKVAEPCLVTIHQESNAGSLSVTAQAQITHKTEQGIGLQFLSMSFEDMVSLELMLLYEPCKMPHGSERQLPTDLPFAISDDEPDSLAAQKLETDTAKSDPWVRKKENHS